MKYKTLILERGVRGRKLKKPVKINVPERQNMAEKRLLQYIVESLSCRSRLIPFVLRNRSTMKIARHLLFNRTGSPFTLFLYINELSYFSEWMKAEPDQLMKMCRKRNGDPNPKGMVKMAYTLDEYIDHLKERGRSPNGIMMCMKNITIAFRINAVGLKLPFDLSVQNWRARDVKKCADYGRGYVLWLNYDRPISDDHLKETQNSVKRCGNVKLYYLDVASDPIKTNVPHLID